MSASAQRRPSLTEQGRQLQALRARILALRDDAELRSASQPRHAAAFHAQAEAEVALLAAEGVRLRDAIVLRARQRARLAWWIAYAAAALALLLAGWWWLQR